MIDEAGIMAKLEHPHVLPLTGICFDDGVKLITPYREYGSLDKHLRKDGKKLYGWELLGFCNQILEVRSSSKVYI